MLLIGLGLGLNNTRVFIIICRWPGEPVCVNIKLKCYGVSDNERVKFLTLLFKCAA